MNDSSPIHEHWSDRVPTSSPLEQRAGDLMRQAAMVPTSDPALLSRVADRLQGWSKRQGIPRLRLALAAGMLVAVSGAVGATVLLRGRVSRLTTPSQTAAPASHSVRVLAVEPAPSRIAEESRLLTAALQLLRQQHDARSALSALDEYSQRFPNGTLAREATLARIDALLELDDRVHALEILDRTQLTELPRARELAVLRGELRGAVGRCNQAVADLGSALDGSGDALEERALWGRASCRSRLGDSAGARSDLGQMISRFPQGNFASKARQALRGR
jgi:tetratricopeptide (TPR) repeat protein